MLGFDSNTSKQTKRTSRRQAEIKFEKMPCQDKAPTRGASHVDLLAPPPNADHWISPSSLNRASSVLIAQFHSPIIKLDSPPTQVVTPFRTKLQFWTKTGLLRYSSELQQTLTESNWSEILDIDFLPYFCFLFATQAVQKVTELRSQLMDRSETGSCTSEK